MSCESSSQHQHQDKDLISSERTENNELLPESQGSSQLLSSALQSAIEKCSDSQFEQMVPEIGQAIRNCSNEALITNKMLHYRLLRLFYRVFKQMDSSQHQGYPLFLLSLLAEMLRRKPEIRLPFNKKTVLALLTFDYDNIRAAKEGDAIVVILSMLFENMGRQGKLMVRLGVEGQFRRGLFVLISKADEYSALRILMRALFELQTSTDADLDPADLQEVTRKVRDILGDIAAQKVRLMLCRPKGRKGKELGQMTLLELVSNK